MSTPNLVRALDDGADNIHSIGPVRAASLMREASVHIAALESLLARAGIKLVFPPPLVIARDAADQACTGITARWCPKCGDCKCQVPRGLAGDMDSPDCPLHALNSMHGQAEDPT